MQMQKFTLIAMMVLNFTYMACQRTRPLTEADLAAVREATEGYMQAVVDGDWDAAVSYFTDDAVRLPMNSPAERGKETIRAHFAAVDSITDWTVHSLEVDGTGDLAYVRIFFTITAYFGGGPEPFMYTGKQLGILERQADGTWKIITDMWNSDALPGT